MADETVNNEPVNNETEEEFVPMCPEWDYISAHCETPQQIPNALIQVQAHGFQLDRIYFGMNGSPINPMPAHIIIGRRKFDKSKWKVNVEEAPKETPKVVL